MPLSDTERERYARQILLEDWDQERLKNAVVLVAGVGGLGSCCSLYLAAAGVGTLRICDGGRIDRPDLNRQILYDENSLGKYKTEVAKKKLLSLNPHIHIDSYPGFINIENIKTLSKDCDLIIDGLDNMETRYILNKESLNQQIPYIYGTVQGWLGYTAFFQPPQTACLACLMPSLQTSSQIIPIAGVAPATIALIQATEALKFLMGSHCTLAGKLLIYDAQSLVITKLHTEKKSSCPHCGSL